MKNSKITLAFLIFLCIIFPFIKALTETDIYEIELNKDKGKTERISEENAKKLIYVKGDIDQDKKYLLISIISDELEPSISVSKNIELAPYQDEYDYTLLSKEKKLVLPSSYFVKDNSGFYMTITWEGSYSDFSLQFEYLNAIKLDIGEELSYFAGNYNYTNFIINIGESSNENEEVKLKLGATLENIGFILSGGDEKQLSMTVNGYKAKPMLNNALGYWRLNDLDYYSIVINVAQNVKFNFKTQIFYNEDDEMNTRDLNEYLNNQYFFVRNNKEDCFNLEKTYDQNNRDLIIVSQEEFSLTMSDSDSTTDQKKYAKKYNEPNAVSDTIKLSNTINKICVKPKKEDDSDNVSLIQIYLNNKNNNYGIMPEPLSSGVTYNYVLPKKEKDTSSNDNVNIHSHSQFFKKGYEAESIIGINTLIKRISGNIKVYKDICNSYPKCSYNEYSRTRKEIFSFDGLYQDLLTANEDTYSGSNKQNIFVVVCEDEKNKCQYELSFNDNQKKQFLSSGDKISKFLEKFTSHLNSKKQDTYYTYLNDINNKIIINLVMYSGDAYLVQINDIKGCKFEEEHFGSDERRVFSCDENEMDDYYDTNNNNDIKIEFGIRAGESNAIYSLYVYEQPKEYNEINIPVEIAKFDTIKKNNNKYKLVDLSKDKNENEKEVVTLINPINCKINLTNEDNHKLYSYDNNYIQFSSLTNKTEIDLILDKYNDYNIIDKCLFQINSYVNSNKDSYLIISENKPIKFKLDNDLNNLRLQYLYSMINGIKKIYLQVNLVGNSPLKIKIENPNEDTINEYIIRDSKTINIMKANKKLPLNALLKIKISVQLYDANYNLYDTIDNQKQALVDLKIISDSDTPIYLKRKEQFSNILINNQYKYYIALINKGSSGNYYINLNNGYNGNIYARLLDSDHIKEIGGWNNRFILPTKDTDKNKLIPFDYENQKLIIEKEHTQFCNKFCYLLIGVNNNYNFDVSDNVITGFNSYLKINDNKGESKDENNFVKLMNNEQISSYVTDEDSDYFSFKLNDYNSKLNISFNCENCVLTLLLNDTDFTSKNAKTYISTGDKIDINLGDDINIENSVVYAKINTINNEINPKLRNKNNKYRYSLKMNSPNDIENPINYMDPANTEKIEFTPENNYYDYAIKLDNYNYDKDINILAAPNTDSDDNAMNYNLKNDIEIYANIVNDDETLDINSWPNRTNYQFPSFSNSTNYLIIDKDVIKEKQDSDNKDKILLIRIYGNGKENNKIDLYTNYENIDNEKDKLDDELLIPGKYQLITVNNSNANASLKIDIPSDLDPNKDYNFRLKKLNGNGRIRYGGDTYELNDKYDSVSFPIDLNMPLSINNIDIKSINPNINSTSNESFTFLIKYEEKNNLNSLEKTKIGSSTLFSSKNDEEPIGSFIPLVNVDYDLPINIDLTNLEISGDDDYKDQIRKNTETFDINAYLINEDELNDIKNGNLSFIGKKKDFKYNGKYYLENRHGYLNINQNDINEFKKKNKNQNTYVYYTIKKSKNNDKKYKKIQGNINIYPENNLKISLPENDYHFNSIDCTTKNSHIYKLGDLKNSNNKDVISSKTHNMDIDFAAPIEGLNVKVVKGPNEKEEDKDYFGITRNLDNNGKDTITITKNIEDAYLLVETPDILLNKTDNYNTNFDYMFKYSYKNKDPKKDPTGNQKISYDNKITNKKMDGTDLKTNITLNKIIDLNTNKPIPVDYYIRINKNNNKKRAKDTKNDYYYPKKNISIISNNDNDDIYAVYKIDANNPLLQNDKENTFTVPIEIETDDPVYLDVVAQNPTDKQVYGYKKVFPNSVDDYDSIDGNNKQDRDKSKEDDKKDTKKDTDEKETGNGNRGSIIKYILIGICVVLMVLLLIICCVKTCYCCGKKEVVIKNDGEGLGDITTHTFENENDNMLDDTSL